MAIEIISRDDARAQGLKRFNTGVPCRHGHHAERMVLDGKCSICVSQRAAVRGKLWAQKNPDKVRAKTLRWREANRENWLESSRRTKERYGAAYNEKQRLKHAEDPEKFRARCRAYYARNREAMIERGKEAERNRRALKKGASGTHTAADARAILAAQGHRCAYCKADLKRKKRHLDHIMPLARGGSNDRTNLQYLCAPCNLAKGAKDPIAFAQSRGLLL